MKNLQSLSKYELICLLQRNGITASEPPQIAFPSDSLKALSKYSNKQTEHSVVILLDGAHAIIKTICISSGTLNRTIVHPRDVYRHAVKHNAQAVIFAHNHPSGNLEPSIEDIEITKRIKEAGEIIGISLVDSIIVSKRGYYSFLENNNL